MENSNSYANDFKLENKGKFVYYNGAQGLTDCLLNEQIAQTNEDAIRAMANRDGVAYEDVECNKNDWYYILPVEEIEDEYLDNYASKYL